MINLWDEFETIRYGVVMNYDVILPWMDRERSRNGDTGVGIRKVTCCIQSTKLPRCYAQISGRQRK